MEKLTAEIKFVAMAMNEMDSRGPVIEPPMTRDELSTWFADRSVTNVAELFALVDNYQGFTLTEMNEIVEGTF